MRGWGRWAGIGETGGLGYGMRCIGWGKRVGMRDWGTGGFWYWKVGDTGGLGWVRVIWVKGVWVGLGYGRFG